MAIKVLPVMSRQGVILGQYIPFYSHQLRPPGRVIAHHVGLNIRVELMDWVLHRIRYPGFSF
jgi:hypothetical protein